MKIVRDLMSPKLISIAGSKTLAEAKDLLLDRGISSVPVLDAYGKPLGLLTELSLIRAFLKLHNSTDKAKDQIFHHRDVLEAVTLIDEETGIPQAIKVFFATPSHRLLVQDSRGIVVGIVSPRDLLKVVSGDFDRVTKMERELDQTHSALRQVSGQLKDAEEILARYHEYLEQAPFFIHSLNEEGRVVFANKRLRQELGYSQGEMVGMPLERLYHTDHVEKSRAGLAKIISEGEHEPVITAMVRKDGTVIRLEAISSALHSAAKDFIATVTMSRPLASDNMLRALNGVLGSADPFE